MDVDATDAPLQRTIRGRPPKFTYTNSPSGTPSNQKSSSTRKTSEDMEEEDLEEEDPLEEERAKAAAVFAEMVKFSKFRYRIPEIERGLRINARRKYS